MAKAKKLIILVSSTVYESEDLLDQIYALLSGFGYEVWMSHKGTIPTFSTKGAFENCLVAVRKCDIFFSIITKHYGSGRDGDELSITHQELRLAIEEKKPRWVLAHHDVVFARTLLDHVGFKSVDERATLHPRKGAIIDDLRVLQMYEDAILHDVPFAERVGNWVQKYTIDEEALLYAQAQFYRYQEVQRFVEDQFRNVVAIKGVVKP